MPGSYDLQPSSSPSNSTIAGALTQQGAALLASYAATLAPKVLEQVYQIASTHGVSAAKSAVEFLSKQASYVTEKIFPAQEIRAPGRRLLNEDLDLSDEQKEFLDFMRQISIPEETNETRLPTIDDLQKIKGYFESLGDEKAKEIFTQNSLELGNNPLAYAASLKNLEFVNYFLSKGFIDTPNKINGITSLMLAAPNLEISQALIEALRSSGAGGVSLYVNEVEKQHGRSALHIAMQSQNVTVSYVETLRENGADIDLLDTSNLSPLSHGAINELENKKESLKDVINYLIESGASIQNSLLGMTYFNGSIDIRKWVNNLLALALQNNPNYLDEENTKGRKPIFWASDFGNDILVEEILSFKNATARIEYVNLVDSNNETPLLLAAKNNGPLVTDSLIRNGANIAASLFLSHRLHGNITISNGENFLTYKRITQAIVQSAITIFSLRGEDFFTTEITDDKTPLFWAVESENHELVRALLSNGNDINQRDEDGRTALFFVKDNIMPLILLKLTAIRYNNDDNTAFYTFDETGIDPRITDNNGQSAAQYLAQTPGNEDIIELIEEASRQRGEVENNEDFFDGVLNIIKKKEFILPVSAGALISIACMTKFIRNKNRERSLERRHAPHLPNEREAQAAAGREDQLISIEIDELLDAAQADGRDVNNMSASQIIEEEKDNEAELPKEDDNLIPDNSPKPPQKLGRFKKNQIVPNIELGGDNER